ncbi:MAG TPA: hypothetical protein GX530_08820 [Corynebacteriales bacterium]|nr:hypothetical protein [Mycobacteriales bacterium]
MSDIPKLASRQIDNFEDVNSAQPRANHRVSFQYNKEIERNVAHIIDNSTGKVVKKLPSDSQVDHMIRMRNLMGLHIDEEA